VRKSGDQVRITAQLIDAVHDTHILSETYDRKLDDIFAIQDEIAAAVVDALKVTLLGQVPKTRETVPECYALYLQGRHFADLNTEAGYRKAEELLKQSIEIAPDYAPTWNVLGEVYSRLTNFTPLTIDAGNTQARAAVEKALSLDPQLAAAYATLAWIEIYYDRDLQAAAEHLRHAIALDPCDARSLRWAALLLSMLGRIGEAIVVGEEVVACDPVNPVGNYNLGLYYYIEGRLDEAQSMFEKHLAMGGSADGGHFSIAKVLLAKGDPEAALDAAKRETDPGWRLEGIALACHDLGRSKESGEAMSELVRRFSADMAYNIAEANAYIGNIDAAFDWLQTAYENRDGGLTEMKREPLMTNLHDDPRWAGLLTKLGLNDEQLTPIEFTVSLPQ
jgi:tetratricopeptide (TPR) repeat protein